jgi:hypothetical protein
VFSGEAPPTARLGSDPANNFVVGASVEDQLVGTAGFYRSKNLKERYKGHIWGLYVAAAMRGQGRRPRHPERGPGARRSRTNPKDNIAHARGGVYSWVVRLDFCGTSLTWKQLPGCMGLLRCHLAGFQSADSSGIFRSPREVPSMRRDHFS